MTYLVIEIRNIVFCVCNTGKVVIMTHNNLRTQ